MGDPLPGLWTRTSSVPAADTSPRRMTTAEKTQPAAAEGGKRITGYQTVLEDPTNYHVKHPLQSRWTLTQKMGQVENASSRGVSTKEWEAGLVANVSIGTVEDFWW